MVKAIFIISFDHMATNSGLHDQYVNTLATSYLFRRINVSKKKQTKKNNSTPDKLSSKEDREIPYKRGGDTHRLR